MKKLYTLLFISFLAKVNSQCNYTLTTSSANGFTITCANPTLHLSSSVTSSNGATFAWAGPSFTANTAIVNITQPGTYTVISMEGITSCTIPQMFTIGINTTVPQSSVTPLASTVSCNNAVTFTGTAISPTTNILHSWFSPYSASSQTSNAVNASADFYSGPGIYFHYLKDLTNGCSTSESMTITSSMAYPTFSLTSSTAFSLGCVPLDQTTLSIVNPQSTQQPSPATCSFTFVAPGDAIPTPSIILGANTSTVTSSPGAWTVIVQDNSNFCRTIVDFPIVQNTVSPHVFVSLSSKTITCNSQTVLATGTSTTPNTTIVFPSYPPLPMDYPSPAVLGVGNGPATSSLALFYCNYTVVATNTVNGCSTTSYIPVYQDFRQAYSIPAIIGSPTAICTSSDIVVLNSNNSYVTSAGQGATVNVVSWVGPAPQQTSSATTYSAYVAGIYTLNIKDSFNGCTAFGIINVTSSGPQFNLQGTAPTSSSSCDGSVVISPQGPTTNSVSVTSGSLAGNNVTGLCYGWLKVCMTFTNTQCKKCDSILINGATAINEIDLEKELSVYPNPTNSDINIKYPANQNGIIRLINVEGKEVQRISFDNSGSSKISDLASGVYLLEVQSGGVVVRKKVVVIR